MRNEERQARNTGFFGRVLPVTAVYPRGRLSKIEVHTLRIVSQRCQLKSIPYEQVAQVFEERRTL